MISQFFKAYMLPNSIVPKEIRDIEKIAVHYYETDLKMDLLALLPFQLLQLTRHRERLFYLIKCVRLIKGIEMLDTKFLIIKLKKSFMTRIEERCKVDNEYANSMFAENYIAIALNLSFMIKTLILSLAIINISYICGMCWLVMCTCVEDYLHDVEYSKLPPSELALYEEDYFITANGMQSMTLIE